MRTAATTAGSAQSPWEAEGEALRERVAAGRVAAGDDRTRPGRLRSRRSGTGRGEASQVGVGPAVRAVPCYGAAGGRPGLSREVAPAGRTARRAVGARSLKKASSAVLRPLPTMWAASTPPARSCWRLAATRSTSQWPAPSGRATPGRGRRARPRRPAPRGPRRTPGSGPDATAGPRKARTRGGAGAAVLPWRRSACPTAPAAVPRQPACTAARTRASGSTRASGTQSATSMTSVTPGVVGDEDVGVGDGVVFRGGAAATVIGGPTVRRRRAVDLAGEDQRVEADAERARRPGPGWPTTASGSVTHVQAEVERVVGGRRHAAVPGRHGHRGPEARRLVPAHEGDRRELGHGS